MNQHTEMLIIEMGELSPEEEDYKEKMLKISSLFLNFDEAFTNFIQEHGYTGNLADVSAKAKFVREKFEAADVKACHNFRDLFNPNIDVKRETVYRICFAFGLSVEETNDFFRRVKLERGFDCHIIYEAVYYFCIRNGLSYSEAQEIIKQISVPKREKAIPKRDVLFTSTIINYINSIDSKEKLIKYITDNIEDFKYNNVTAIKYIQELWDNISKDSGLAKQEGVIINRACNRYEDKSKKGKNDSRKSEVIKEEEYYQKTKIKPEDYVVVESKKSTKNSTWTVFSQIIGLQNYQSARYAAQKYDRSITSVLSDNALIPLNASYCFPSRENIDKLLRGELCDNEIMRKMLIFLVFYTYWVKIIIRKNSLVISAKLSDCERCLETINGRLLDAGYPELYAGNPYDWLFMWSLYDDNPLDAFRLYMGEVFKVNREENKED